jgi:TolB-like protein
LVALDPLSEFGQRALIRAYVRAGRRGEALRQYKSCAETLKRELGVAPDVETQSLANDIARSGGVREPSRVAVDREFIGLDFGLSLGGTPDQPQEDRTPGQLEASSQGAAKLRWPCSLPSISVAVAPLRNLTGDPDQQYLVEAFTDDLVTDLLWHGRALSLKPLEDEPAALGNGIRTSERGFDYVVTGSAQSSAPGLLRVNMRITDAATSEYLWAGRHEFKPEDLAPIQTRITRRISRELHVLLLQAASRRAFIASGMDIGIAECLSEASAEFKGRIPQELTAEGQR